MRLIYADDTTQIACASTINKVATILSSEPKEVDRWAKENKMVLNLGKTKSMLVCSPPKLRKLDVKDLAVKTGDGQIASREAAGQLPELGYPCQVSTWKNP